MSPALKRRLLEVFGAALTMIDLNISFLLEEFAGSFKVICNQAIVALL